MEQSVENEELVTPGRPRRMALRLAELRPIKPAELDMLQGMSDPNAPPSQAPPSAPSLLSEEEWARMQEEEQAEAAAHPRVEACSAGGSHTRSRPQQPSRGPRVSDVTRGARRRARSRHRARAWPSDPGGGIADTGVAVNGSAEAICPYADSHGGVQARL
ncbi:hypothetical protein Mth01_22740 [Sphaerimonospora thailandensis]|uniref:Uncharacterized protein n=1 Tax=Sphaerimonospora thailandensis TaxID=795644 RepID=A0A8J3VZM2_9ACTN|nr:hypothetical protein Mth01_22740 [Sphaerimonospora thailandensis]